MTGKSRHKRGRHVPQSRKRKGKWRFSTPVVQNQAVAGTHESVSSPDVLAPSVNVPAPMAKLATVRYPHIAAELRTIGILAGIVLVILAILAVVLS